MSESQDSTAARFWAKVEKNGPVPQHRPDLGPCWVWKRRLDKDGYGGFWLNGRNVRAHRVAWEWQHGPLADGELVLHACDTPACVRPDHLFTGTQSVNVADKVTKGRQAKGDTHPSRTQPGRLRRGERNAASKLDHARVESIRARFAAGGISKAELARQAGVSDTQIGNIVRGKHWRKS